MTEIYDAKNAPTRDQLLSQARQNPATKPATTTRPAARVVTQPAGAVFLDRVHGALRSGHTVEELAAAAGVSAVEIHKAIYRESRVVGRTGPTGAPLTGGNS